MSINRRQFIANTALAGMAMTSPFFTRQALAGDKPLFRISLAQWSLNKSFFDGTLDPVEFAAISARTFGIEAIEYVNQFYADTLNDALVKELRRRADDEGVVSNLIMIDREGALGNPDKKDRQTAVENHYKRADAAHVLACRSMISTIWPTCLPLRPRRFWILTRTSSPEAASSISLAGIQYSRLSSEGT